MSAGSMGALQLALGMQQQLAQGIEQNYANGALAPGESLANMDAAGTAVQMQGVAVNASNAVGGVDTYA